MLFSILLALIASFLLAFAGWKVFEGLRDRRLFSSHSEHDFSLNLSTARALRIFKHNTEIVPIDVRPRLLFEQQHLPGALNAPFVNGNLDTSSINDLSRDTPLLIYCDGGHRSRNALKSLKSKGFRSVYHLNRGLMMWRLFGGPTSGNRR